MGLLFVCGQPFADSAQQRREGAHFGLGQYYLGCHDRSPSAASVLRGPGGTTSILRRCGSHKGTIAQNNRGPVDPDHLPVPAGARVVVCRKGIDTERHGTEGNPMTATGDLPDRDSDRPAPRDEIPNPETGVGIGARSEPDTFEPEEDPE